MVRSLEDEHLWVSPDALLTGNSPRWPWIGRAGRSETVKVESMEGGELLVYL